MSAVDQGAPGSAPWPVALYAKDAGDDSTQPLGCDDGALIVRARSVWAGAAEAIGGVSEGGIVELSTRVPTHYALQVQGDAGDPREWTVELVVSLDGVHWTPILTHTTADGVGTLIGGEGPLALYMRARVVAVDSDYDLRVLTLAR